MGVGPPGGRASADPPRGLPARPCRPASPLIATRLELDLDVFAGPFDLLLVADPARGARPAGGRAGRDRARLPRPPRGPRRARPRVRDRVPRPDRRAARAQVAADAARARRSRSSTSWCRPRRPRSCSSGCSPTRASAAPAATWPRAARPSRPCCTARRRCRLELRRAPLEHAEQAYDPAVLGQALGGLLRTPPPIDLAPHRVAARRASPSGSACCAACCGAALLVRRGRAPARTG